ncbi:MAG: hypothetical protein OXE40_09955, partial [Gammaproteobacteria bacterium]|nr:hypothetical protein [Gammaproteobacteria bacterium]
MREDDSQPEHASGAETIAVPQRGADQASGTTEDQAPSWLSDHRVTVPGQVPGYLERSALSERCMPTRRRITVLKAPGGFGKTVLLAACCRALGKQGVPTAWLGLDEKDEPSVLDTYLAYALLRAGLDVRDPMTSNDAASRSGYSRVDILLAALESRREPFVLALDELEKVTSPESVALLNRLVRARVPGLHLAVACRELPPGLDIANPLFMGDVEILTAEDLRFSQPEISRFFAWRLTRRELKDVARESAGWPIALRIYGNAGAPWGEARARVIKEVVDNWVTSRLWSGLSPDDQEFLLDVGLLRWVDGDLLDEALGGTGLKHRLDGLQSMAGLFEPVHGKDGSVWRLHPLIREYCAKRRRRETPERYRWMQGRLAVALARRGDLVAAMQHAAEAEDAALAGRVLNDLSGFRVYMREGSERLISIDRHLPEATLAISPRLVLVRVVAHIVQGRLAEARRVLDASAADFAESTGHENPDQDVDWCMTWALLNQNACEPVGSGRFKRMISQLERFAESPPVEPALRVAIECPLCQIYNMTGDFDAALERGGLARQWLDPAATNPRMVLDFLFGQIAMAQGHAGEAAAWYGSGRELARRHFLNDPRLTVLGEVLIRELDLERNRVVVDGEVPQIPKEFWTSGSQLASYAAASSVAAELALTL